MVNYIEGFLQKRLNSISKAYDKFTSRFHKKGILKWTIQRSLLIAGIMIVVLNFTLSKWSDAEITKSIVKVERSFIEEQFNQNYIESTKAQKLVTAWLEEKSDENSIETYATEPRILHLKAGTTGGKVRAEPSMSGAVLHIVSSNEPMTYLDEKQQNGEIIWLKVQTKTNHIGWISSRIVE